MLNCGVKTKSASPYSLSLLPAWLVLAGALVLGSTTGHAQLSLPANTGLDSLGNKLNTPGDQDANWTVVAKGTGDVTLATDPVVFDLPTPVDAQFAIQNTNYNNTPTDAGWIWDTGSSGAIPPGEAVVFQMSFDLTGANVAGATISGFWGADNAGILSLNDVDFSNLPSLPGGTPGNFKDFTFFSFSGLNPGVNTLQVTAINAGTDPNPAAVLVGGLQFNPSFSAVPEPSTYGIIGALLLFGLIATRRFLRPAVRK